MTLDRESPTVALRRFRSDEPLYMRERFAKDLMRALDQLGVKPGDGFVVAPLVVQPSLESDGRDT